MATIKRNDPRWVCASGGWYLFRDGALIWFNGLSAWEKKYEISKHGSVVLHSRYGEEMHEYFASRGIKW